jgi:hypothetical protein
MSKGRAKNRKRNTSEPAHVKMHGVITEDRVQEQVERTGTYPFTFASCNHCGSRSPGLPSPPGRVARAGH